ncbi:MAG: L,D-transpeptidase [Leptolyngbya sp. SIO1E4]|nr:L,D-transpeptidase [Leptolyngbya sp. SIO1E4]
MMLAGQSQAIAETLESSPSTIDGLESAASLERALLSPQPVDVSVSANPRPLNWPTVEPILPEARLPVRLVIRLSDRRVYVYRGDDVEVSFPIAVGRTGWETPTGEFQVFSMLENPGWTNPFTNEVMPPGPENPLGDRWIAFWTDGTNQIGFHGTPERESIGQAASHGCIRLYNEHVRALYQLVDVGTTVTIEP